MLAGVDSRVMKVQIWMDNGDMVPAILKPGTWEGTKLFAITVPSDGPRPQLLVAFADATGTVLQSVDLGDRFGNGWLPAGGKHCAGYGHRDLAATGLGRHRRRLRRAVEQLRQGNRHRLGHRRRRPAWAWGRARWPVRSASAATSWSSPARGS